ncbi:MAG: hypothetical protein QOE70_4037 [Chthoniobacter sp.]|nr:hypothetical protein [Chthoniobacter sp.]
MDEWERIAGEPFTLNGQPFVSVTVEELTAEIRMMLGGRFRDAQSRMLLSTVTIAASGIVKGSIVTVRGVRMRVTAAAESDGTGTFWIPLGPTQIEPPEL